VLISADPRGASPPPSARPAAVTIRPASDPRRRRTSTSASPTFPTRSRGSLFAVQRRDQRPRFNGMRLPGHLPPPTPANVHHHRRLLQRPDAGPPGRPRRSRSPVAALSRSGPGVRGLGYQGHRGTRGARGSSTDVTQTADQAPPRLGVACLAGPTPSCPTSSSTGLLCPNPASGNMAPPVGAAAAVSPLYPPRRLFAKRLPDRGRSPRPTLTLGVRRAVLADAGGAGRPRPRRHDIQRHPRTSPLTDLKVGAQRRDQVGVQRDVRNPPSDSATATLNLPERPTRASRVTAPFTISPVHGAPARPGGPARGPSSKGRKPRVDGTGPRPGLTTGKAPHWCSRVVAGKGRGQAFSRAHRGASPRGLRFVRHRVHGKLSVQGGVRWPEPS